MTTKQKIGWREWVGLPEFEVPALKAKVDTGARTSSLHALDPEPFLDRGMSFVRFMLLPVQETLIFGRVVTAPMVDLLTDRRADPTLERPSLKSAVLRKV